MDLCRQSDVSAFSDEMASVNLSLASRIFLFTPTLCPETSGDPWEADAASRAYTPTISRALPRLAAAVHSPGPTGRGLTAPLCPLGQPPAPPHRLKEVLFPSRSLSMFHWQTHKPCRPQGIKPSCAGTEKCHPLLKSPPKKKKKKTTRMSGSSFTDPE